MKTQKIPYEEITFEKMGVDVDKLDEHTTQAFFQLFNMMDVLIADNKTLTEEILGLKKEIAELKGEQGKPDIPGNNRQKTDISSENERKKSAHKNGRHKHKKALAATSDPIPLSVNEDELPPDAVYKGTRPFFVQEIELVPTVIQYDRDYWYSPSRQKSYFAPLPGSVDGVFGPKLKALILECKHSFDMTEGKIHTMLTGHGVDISIASIDRIINEDKEEFHREKTRIVVEGLKHSLFAHLDATAARMLGENWHTFVLVTSLMAAYFTEKHKNRLTILSFLQFGKLTFYYDEEADILLETLRVSKKTVSKLRAVPRNTFLTQEEIDKLIPQDIGRNTRTRLLEALAISAYHHQTRVPVIAILIVDDAPEFKLVARYLQLCWVHEGRLYKKMLPELPLHKTCLSGFLTWYWEFYDKLILYRKKPTGEKAAALRREFREKLSEGSVYGALKERQEKTLAKEEELLLVLRFPQIAIQNNLAERRARHPVRKRDISFQTRTVESTRVQDTFLTIVETAKLHGVNVYDYFYDRISKTYALASLADLICAKGKKRPSGILSPP